MSSPPPRGSLLKVAVTGGPGAGKSLVCRRLAERGAAVISCDELARKAVRPGSAALEAVVRRFGTQVRRADGGLDRAGLRRLILSDDQARRDLEAIVHPEIIRLLEAAMRRVDPRRAAMIVVEVPLLVELGLESRFDRIVAVTAADHLKEARLVERDGVLRHQARQLRLAHLDDARKCAAADVVLTNDGSPADLREAADRLFDRLRNQAAESA